MHVGALPSARVYSGGHSGQVSPIESSTPPHFGDRLIRRDAGQRIQAGGFERALPRVRIGPFLHPAVLLALADGASFL